MTDSKLVERLKRYEELAELSSLPVHPDMPGYTTGQLLQDAREAAAALEAAEEALHGLITVLAEPANLTPEIALDKEALPRFLDECERATQEAVARARSAYALIRGGDND